MFGDEEEYCFNTYYVSFLVSLFDQFLGLVVVTIYDGSFLPQTKTALCSHYNVPHTSLHHRCRFVYIFCRHNPGDPFKERVSPNDQGWPRGSIRRKEWAKVFEATFHPGQWTYLPPLQPQPPLPPPQQPPPSPPPPRRLTISFPLCLYYKFEKCGSEKSFSNSVLNCQFRGSIKSNGGH